MQGLFLLLWLFCLAGGRLQVQAAVGTVCLLLFVDSLFSFFVDSPFYFSALLTCTLSPFTLFMFFGFSRVTLWIVSFSAACHAQIQPNADWFSCVLCRGPHLG